MPLPLLHTLRKTLTPLVGGGFLLCSRTNVMRKLILYSSLFLFPKLLWAAEPLNYPVPTLGCCSECKENEPKLKEWGDHPIHFDTVLSVQLGETVYHIPAGYLNPRPQSVDKEYTNENLDKEVEKAYNPEITNKREEIGIAFWMPNLRYSQMQGLVSTPREMVCEKGFPPADLSEQFIVYAKLREHTASIRRKEYLNRLKLLATSSEVDERYQLTRYESGTSHKKYVFINDKEPSLYLLCANPKVKTTLMVCGGTVYFEKANLYYYIEFPAYHLDKWQEIVKSVKLLFDRWKA